MGPPAGGSEGRRDLPTGVVTFLFTDIEGSTRLVQDLGASWDAISAEHDELLRRAIAEHGGTEVNTEGDAFFAVFTSPLAAISAAVTAQQALAARTAEPPIRVRMGLHTGEGLLGGKDYVGLDVHRAARVASAAHGGQVLVSDATRALLSAEPLPGLTLRELGAFKLKDIDEPVRLHQLAVDGLAGGFPPPRAKRLGMLPTPRTSFIGRRDTLRELDELLEATRLLVLTGPGGTGKTRLALELARSVEDRFDDGAFFVPLDAVSDARLVPSAILAALEVPPGARPPDEALREAVASMEVLLVLDNLEQLADVGAAVDDLLQAATGIKVVATSRVALRVYGEQEYHVPPLALAEKGAAGDPQAPAGSEAVTLFVERARASRPDFRLSEQDAPIVAEICRRLDGLPLAIELAAARTRLLPPAAILARLDQRLKLLQDHAPNLPPRQRSLRGAIEWSYALLTPPEQRLLDRLGIFVGGWDLEAAEEVVGDPEGAPEGDPPIDVLEGLGSLLDKSLIDRDEATSEGRFRMLQTIAEYARERLAASGELEVIAERHARHVLQVVEAAEPEFVGADPAACVARLIPEQPNIHAAIEWALASDRADIGLGIGSAVWRLWQLRGQLAEGRRYLDALLALPSAASPTELRARALTAAGGIAYWQSDPKARERYEEALAIRESLGDEEGVAASQSDLGFAALAASPPDPEQALGHFVESLRRYEQLGDARMVASLTGSVGFAQMGLGRLEEARAALERALELNLAGGYRGRAADNRFALGNALRRLGRLTDAAGMYRAALEDALEMQDAARTLTYLSAVAAWAVESERLPEAIRLQSAVRRAAREQGGALNLGAVDPVHVAREAGVDEQVIGAEVEAGERLGREEAVAFAFGLVRSADPPA